MILVADSGSTKTEWVSKGLTVTTQGINPVRDSKEQILEVIRKGLMPRLYADRQGTQSLDDSGDDLQIFFYGAGCIEPFINNVREALEEVFPQSRIEVYSDLLGAARALCGRQEGIACILGTGSNSCLCRDGLIVKNISPLGFILGDEGSGAVLGRTLISEMLKGSLTHLWESFSHSTGLCVSDIIDKVYRQPQPNKFLASLVPFIEKNIDDKKVEELVICQFCIFLERNVKKYRRDDLTVNFVGGLASSFHSQLQEACKRSGVKIGKIIRRPASEMLSYHAN